MIAGDDGELRSWFSIWDDLSLRGCLAMPGFMLGC